MPDVEEDPLDMDDVVAQYFQECNPTLNLDDPGLDELLNGNLQHNDGDQFDYWDTENPVMNDDNDYNFNNSPNLDFTTNGVEGENPEYVGNVGDEVETNSVVPFPVWPPVPTPFNCSYCHVLREIIHENGANSMKLEIHGRIGFICHAIYEMQTNVIDGPPIVNYEMVDFTMQSMESVKQFIVQYCQSRTQEGYVLLPDPLSVYYDALCYGLNWFNNVDSDELNPPSEASHIGAEEENRTPANTNDTRTPRPGLASQRQRTRALTLNDLTRRFHVPINTVAKELQICTTVIKKKCREFGVKRWPSRAVISKTKKLLMLETSLRDGNGNRNTNSEIETLRKQLEDIYACRDVDD
ncbi:hypothetical protein C5167_044860 [Papaver somniferum]|uniref:uncharacterized protein LOC113337312 isoform X2 n=1 Tax=Papaver somniferum TaxID=3469 RepID=UPI000E7013F0|nr:uncharacterized protein LOC113337312 isoform X2 [Papaver somniferum]RZC90034.1 hypothetical protein C5167_044860 [Papaver somniferum]